MVQCGNILLKSSIEHWDYSLLRNFYLPTNEHNAKPVVF